MKQHRFVLIGHGNISTKYISAIRSKLPFAEIVGVIGRSSIKVEAFAEEHGIPYYGTDLREVAENAEATAAIICTPNALHHEGVLQASRLGLHCLCEKPLHISAEKQADMIRSCRENGVKLGVSYMRRLIRHMQDIKQLMDAGQLGRIMVVDVVMKHFRPHDYYDSWHGTMELDGGGPFLQQGSHIVDIAQWLCGGYHEVLDARRFQVYHDIETEDHGYAIVRYENGAVGMIEASTASTGMKTEYIEISGTKGSIKADYEGIISFQVPGVEPPEPSHDESNARLFERLVVDFAEAIEQEREPFITGESARKATELILDIYMKSGQPIRLLRE
ncbi:Gfo/Idh/MocA family oxidoreductase [Paenibacillus sp. GD4]|uniref:Gfo/Idh/MocA family protein n=1 Tax=Paenibacillus sp. GD4 TaxID=3068890 RepID=UPI002796514B|nr:Gfo/Idh/MocA family oxidoreductase [Paenibacillus sp. GD4]MDQ1912080.1 Gfo/Idh/MocA family oxidoreductase [Paenibacillus sp. GD4]